MTKALIFKIRMNKIERELFDKRASAVGLKPTAYARSLLFPKRIVATKPKLTPSIISHLDKVASTTIEIDKIVATKQPSKKLIKPKVYKSTAEVMKDYKPNPETVKKAEISYRRFAAPGEMLKK